MLAETVAAFRRSFVGANRSLDSGAVSYLLYLQWLRYDTFALSYIQAYDSQLDDDSGFDAELHAAAYAMCKLGVIVMADFVA